MANESEKFRNLPSDVKSLISDGVYSLYSLSDTDNFVLITDRREMYVLNGDGTIIRQATPTETLNLGTSVSLPRESNSRTLKVNYA